MQEKGSHVFDPGNATYVASPTWEDQNGYPKFERDQIRDNMISVRLIKVKLKYVKH